MVKGCEIVKKKVMPYVMVILVQFGGAGFGIVAKAALNQGSSSFTFSVYRNAIAAALLAPFAFFLERKTRPKMTLNVAFKIFLLCLFDPVIGQNMFYSGMKHSSATIASAMCNLIPALTFVASWILRVEKVNLKSRDSHARILGTLITLGGAMIMTLINRTQIRLPWTNKARDNHASTNPYNKEHPVEGTLLMAVGCIGYALFYTLQAITLESYPAGLSLTVLICTLGALLGTVLTFLVEKANTSVWVLRSDAKLLAYIYGGIVSSGLTYYVSGIVMKKKGPVFVTAFNPLSFIIVAILSSFIFAEKMTVGKVTGGIVIIIGLYLVIWGKSKDQETMELLNNPETKGVSINEAKANGVDGSTSQSTVATGPNAV